MRSIFIFCFLFLSVISTLCAQSDCELTLTNAQAEFDAGRFHAVPSLLKDCLEKNQNREWKQRAYLLLAETYLLLENPEMADDSYLKVLKASPEFVTDEKRDPIDLVYLSKKFTATPIFSLTGRVGLNTTFINVIHDVKITGDVGNDISTGETESYSMKAGWQAGFGVDYHYSSKIAVSAEANYAFYSFSQTTKDLFLDAHNTLLFTDRQTWINVPVLIKYTSEAKGLRPFAYLGYSANLLLRDRADMVLDGDKESPVFDYKSRRNAFASSFVVGGGLKYKWGLRYFFADVRYSLGLTNVTKAPPRYDNIIFSWPHADDDFRMNNVYVSIGYIHPFYKARKLKKANTKSVLRKTKKLDEQGN